MAGDLARSGLSEGHSAVVRLLADGVPQSRIAVATGYSEGTVYNLARNPKIEAAVHELVMHKLRVVAAPAALKTLLSIALDETAEPRVRIAAGNSILDRAGYTAKAAEEAHQERTAEEMTTESLQATMQIVQRELGNRARQPGNAPDSDPKTVTIDSKPLNPLD